MLRILGNSLFGSERAFKESCRAVEVKISTVTIKEGTMKRNSIEFIYQAMNAIASGKHDRETEQCLSDAIEEELLAMNASLVLASWLEISAPAAQLEAHIA
jgi:hypothetical protein